MSKTTNNIPENKNLGPASTGMRPDDLLPDLQITVNGATAPHCSPQGVEVRSYTGSFLVSLSDARNAKVELPAHRWFFKAVKNQTRQVKNKTHYLSLIHI